MIQERIAAGRKLGIHDMKEMLLDTTDVYCRKVIDCLVKVVDAQLLRGFNCSFSSQSSQATVY